MQYSEFIRQINTGKLKKVSFYLNGYAHYKNCCIETKYSNPQSNTSLLLISIKLTPDNYENYGFLKQFNENYKLFDLKAKGKFTLKQLWNRITITDVVMNDT